MKVPFGLGGLSPLRGVRGGGLAPLELTTLLLLGVVFASFAGTTATTEPLLDASLSAQSHSFSGLTLELELATL